MKSKIEEAKELIAYVLKEGQCFGTAIEGRDLFKVDFEKWEERAREWIRDTDVLLAGEVFTVTGFSEYFQRKYNLKECPTITIKGNWKEINGKGWMESVLERNPAAVLFNMRLQHEHRMVTPPDEEVFYGKVLGIGELVFRSELRNEAQMKELKERVNEAKAKKSNIIVL
jgi:hypothetical protein